MARAVTKQGEKVSEPQVTSEAEVKFTPSMFKDMLVEVIKEARKPVVTEKELRDQEQLQQERLANAANVKQERQNRINLQKTCSHMRRDGSCRAVYIKGSGADSGNFMICQYCQAKVHPFERPANSTSDDIFDPALFNKLFQAAGAAEIFE
jgi:hypothetical protein